MNVTQTSPSSARSSTAMRVVCGIDASHADETAVREACELAGPRGHVALVCVVSSFGVGYTAQATITPSRASEALERAMKQARAAGVPSSVYLLRSPHAPEAMLGAGADGDVLVVGTHGGSRAGGITLGSVATTALHRASVPVLVARTAADAERSILVASDGSPESNAACELAGSIAARTGAAVTLFTVEHDGDGERRHELARQAVELKDATGREPTVATTTGKPADEIVEAAKAVGASLVVLGNRGRTGLRALGSVSERVAHRAPCSVLVVRPKPD